MQTTNQKSVCFTGYRTSKLLRSNNDPKLIQNIYNDILTAVEDLYRRGYNIFYSGMAEGFDMIAAEVVIHLKEQHPDIRLIVVIPYQGQELSYSQRDQLRYKMIFSAADDWILISETYHDKVYLVRNDYMLAHSSVVVCYYDGQRGGTMYTYNRALKQCAEVINICTGEVFCDDKSIAQVTHK